MLEIKHIKDNIYVKIYSYNYTGKYVIFKRVLCDVNGKKLYRKKRTVQTHDDINKIYEMYPDLKNY